MCFFFKHDCVINVHRLLIKAELFQVLNIDLKAALLNFVYFLFRIKILIIAVPGGSSDELKIKMHLIVE